ncbi:MAG: sugar kinase, partial [Halobacteria archaeon]|nr:sugar kinase [Halobacteria archaeon]
MTRAFAPGHITCFFAAAEHDDPLESGSRGAGIVVEDGVTAEVSSASGDESSVIVDGDDTEFETVERLLDMLDVTARVEVESEIPIGAGFGASGSATLATALAANTEFELGHEREQVVAAAHVAEVKSGTGLGDVVQARLLGRRLGV